MSPAKSVAVVGLGPAGAITVDALVREGVFDVIKLFERREKAGGCWIPDRPGSSHELPNLNKLASRTADETPSLPSNFPTWAPRPAQYRFSETSIYPDLETNICARAMEFSQEPIADTLSPLSIERHGVDSPFRHHTVIQEYIEALVNRNGYEDLVSLNTTVELIEKTSDKPTSKWELTLRKEGPPPPPSSPSLASTKTQQQQDYWYKESFDAVVIASGHYTVPFIPHIDGLAEFAKAYPGSVEHSKSFRGSEKYEGKRVLTVGSSISGPDIAFALALASENTSSQTIHASIRADRYHPYFGDYAFRHPLIQRHGPIAKISSTRGERTVYFQDGTFLPDVDHIIIATGYSWTLPFLPDVEVRNNRVPGLYMHVFPTAEEMERVVFVGAVAAGFTFKVFEWQAVLASRYLADRISLPPILEQQKWELDRIAAKGDGVAFTALYPDFKGYFEEVRKLVEQDSGDGGRKLPVFDEEWRREFDEGHLKRIAWWTRENERAEREKMSGVSGVREMDVVNGLDGTGANGDCTT